MGLYLFYVSCSLALQISVASMSAINRYNDQLPDEGGSAAVSSLMLALAAPVILLLVIGGMSLWVCTLPGGLSLLQDFVLQGVNVGETRFNMVQVLLIISVFFLTRTAVRMGTLFLSRMPSRGLWRRRAAACRCPGRPGHSPATKAGPPAAAPCPCATGNAHHDLCRSRACGPAGNGKTSSFPP